MRTSPHSCRLAIRSPRLSLRLASLAATGLLSFGVIPVQAQSSLYSAADVGVLNSAISPYVGGLDFQSSDTGAPVSASGTHSFTGMDRNGFMQTMTFSGSVTASAQYGQLHSSAAGTVTNSYYNANNPAYYNSNTNVFNPAGSPDALVSLNFATFNDTLQFGGALQAGYQARYIFHVDGSNSGYGTLADLSVTIAGNNELFFDGNAGNFSADWATQSYAINGTTPQSINVQFSTQFVLNTYDVADGTNASGISNFSDTATLSGVEIVDANGNPVSGVTVTSGSGMNYLVVPEPSSLAMIGFGITACLLLGRHFRRARRDEHSLWLGLLLTAIRL